MSLTVIDRCFLAHPRAVGQGYFEHMKFAWSFGSALLTAAFAAFVHGVVPAVFSTAASTTIRRLHTELDTRGGSPPTA